MFSMLEESYHRLDRPMKTAILVGGVAVAAGVAYAFYAKSAAAAPALAPAAITQKWTPATSFVPGTFYTVVATPQTTQTANGTAFLDRVTAASSLSASGWSNGQIVYYPGDVGTTPTVNGLSLAPTTNQYVFQGTYGGAAMPVPAGVTAYALTA